MIAFFIIFIFVSTPKLQLQYFNYQALNKMSEEPTSPKRGNLDQSTISEVSILLVIKILMSLD